MSRVRSRRLVTLVAGILSLAAPAAAQEPGVERSWSSALLPTAGDRVLDAAAAGYAPGRTAVLFHGDYRVAATVRDATTGVEPVQMLGAGSVYLPALDASF